MPLTQASMAADIEAALDAIAPTTDAESGELGAAWRSAFAAAVAGAIVQNILANATVQVTTVCPSGGGSGVGTVL